MLYRLYLNNSGRKNNKGNDTVAYKKKTQTEENSAPLKLYSIKWSVIKC